MSQFKLNIPLVVEAENADEAQVNAIAAMADVDSNDGVEFFLDSIVDTGEIEELDEDNLSEGEGEEDDADVNTGDEDDDAPVDEVV